MTKWLLWNSRYLLIPQLQQSFTYCALKGIFRNKNVSVFNINIPKCKQCQVLANHKIPGKYLNQDCCLGLLLEFEQNSLCWQLFSFGSALPLLMCSARWKCLYRGPVLLKKGEFFLRGEGIKTHTHPIYFCARYYPLV